MLVLRSTNCALHLQSVRLGIFFAIVDSLLRDDDRCDRWRILQRYVCVGSARVFRGFSRCLTDFGILRSTGTYGRRPGILVTGSLASIGGLLSAVAPSFGFLLFSRFLVGIGVGCAGIAFAYALEFTPPVLRGTVGIYLNAIWTVGTSLQVLLAWMFVGSIQSEDDGMNASWRWMVGITAVPLIFLTVSAIFFPESPVS